MSKFVRQLLDLLAADILSLLKVIKLYIRFGLILKVSIGPNPLLYKPIFVSELSFPMIPALFELTDIVHPIIIDLLTKSLKFVFNKLAFSQSSVPNVDNLLIASNASEKPSLWIYLPVTIDSLGIIITFDTHLDRKRRWSQFPSLKMLSNLKRTFSNKSFFPIEAFFKVSLTTTRLVFLILFLNFRWN